MKILALSPDYDYCAYCILDNGTFTHGYAPINVVPGRAARRYALFCWIAKHVDKLDFIVIEQAWTPAAVSLATTVCDAAFLQEVPAYMVRRRQWQRALLGHSRATEQEMLLAARRVAFLPGPAEPHLVKAICLAQVAARYPGILRRVD
jgi:hypothetical protein